MINSETAPSDADGCRLCETPLPVDAKACPRCGLPVRHRGTEPVVVHPWDIWFTVIMAVAAGTVTFPLTCSAVVTWIQAGWTGTNFGGLIGVAVWNSFILGVPLVILARRWMTRVRRGDFDRGWMWRDYWWFQMLAFSPVVGGMIALYSFTGRLDSLRWVLGF